ncbi:hypothetical protein ACJMK2_019259 [Sinanodonta woodiana]|uniref:PDZ domain-containing protein n=1 Tax=Sinanodonta woodiana TaxID=1069815 RepID=A0ABD3UHY4_SINWO
MDEIDGPLYEVFDRAVVSEVGGQPANTPLLHPQTLSENLPYVMEHLDGPYQLAGISQDDGSSSLFLSSSSSSDYSDDEKHREKQWQKKNRQGERPHKVKFREKQLFINGKTRVCEIKTCTYYYKDEKNKQHYIIRIKGSTDIMGKTGLRPYDEIISVNGVHLEGMKQKDVLKLVKKIKPKSCGLIDLKLEFRRWKDANNGSVRSASQDIHTGPVRSASQYIHTSPVQSTIITVRLDLQLQPARGSSRSTVRRKEEETEYEQALPKGNVTDITFKNGGTACIKVLASEGSYLLASHKGSISVGLLDNNDNGLQSKSEFDITPFQGKDDSAMPKDQWVFGYIIHHTVDGVTSYLTSCLNNGSNRLVFRQYSGDLDQKSPDERFFLIHEDGDKIILESMLYRGKCVHFDAPSTTLNLQSLNMKYVGSMNDDKCGDFLLNVFRTDLTFFSKLLREVNANMNCLLPVRTRSR